MFKIKQKNYNGFTLIEVLVSITIFTLAVSLGVLALTSMSNTSKRIQVKEQSVQSAYFLLDSVTRSIRMGTAYQCANEIGTPGGSCDSPTTPANGISYIDQEGLYTTVYFRKDSGKNYGSLYRLVSTNPEANPIEERLHDAYALRFTDVGFIIDGADTGDGRQPIVSMRLLMNYSFKSQEFYVPIQTTLTQRQIDIGVVQSQ